MPRFYIDTNIHGKVIADLHGMTCRNAKAAIQKATEDIAAYAADRIAHGEPANGDEVILRGEDGQVIERFLVRDALMKVL